MFSISRDVDHYLNAFGVLSELKRVISQRILWALQCYHQFSISNDNQPFWCHKHSNDDNICRSLQRTFSDFVDESMNGLDFILQIKCYNNSHGIKIILNMAVKETFAVLLMAYYCVVYYIWRGDLNSSGCIAAQGKSYLFIVIQYFCGVLHLSVVKLLILLNTVVLAA